MIMTVLDNFKSKNIDEFIDWLDEYVAFDTAPWMWWWDNVYCKKCFSEDCYASDYSYCETHNRCRYFQNMDEIPSVKQIIKMWLESEYNNGV